MLMELNMLEIGTETNMMAMVIISIKMVRSIWAILVGVKEMDMDRLSIRMVLDSKEGFLMAINKEKDSSFLRITK